MGRHLPRRNAQQTVKPLLRPHVSVFLVVPYRAGTLCAATIERAIRSGWLTYAGYTDEGLKYRINRDARRQWPRS
jgi:hypothetical protein